MRILVVEDELHIAQNIADSLKTTGLLPEIVGDGEEAWFKGSTEPYGAIILDLGLPKLDGLTLMKRWRAEGIETPILVLSARGTWAERVDGIDSGADDYLTKPFQMQELVARLRALLRRASGHAAPSLTMGPLHIDLRSSVVTVGGTLISLTPLEYRLIHFLAMQKGRVVTQVELAEALYAHDHERDANAIEAVISRLRRKLGSDIIKTKRGFGYFIATTTA
ncbi:MAG: response regulator transcription factor [Alphaproteobacteria bacterium]|nr:response regulator transcription factor [Alphaproteobacteria bacterium]